LEGERHDDGKITGTARRLHARVHGGLIIAGLIMWLASALADPLPAPKPPGPGGSCPFGYTSSGSFCVPSRGAQDAIAKPANGTCPWGWLASGSYCLRSGSR
jgi:hypothetical protein